MTEIYSWEKFMLVFIMENFKYQSGCQNKCMHILGDVTFQSGIELW